MGCPGLKAFPRTPCRVRLGCESLIHIDAMYNTMDSKPHALPVKRLQREKGRKRRKKEKKGEV
jgi:hypothetical protein